MLWIFDNAGHAMLNVVRSCAEAQTVTVLPIEGAGERDKDEETDGVEGATEVIDGDGDGVEEATEVMDGDGDADGAGERDKDDETDGVEEATEVIDGDGDAAWEGDGVIDRVLDTDGEEDDENVATADLVGVE